MTTRADDLYREALAMATSPAPVADHQDRVVDAGASFVEEKDGADARPPQTIAETVAAFENAEDIDAIFDIIRGTPPPSEAIDRRLLREKLLPLLKKKGLSGPAGAIDDWFDRGPAEGSTDPGGAVTFREPERWGDEVDGAELIGDLVDYFRMFLAAPEEVVFAAALWTLFTHVYDLFDIAPILLIASPTKRCGKSTVLDLIFRVAARAIMSSNITGPALFRTIEKYSPTLLIDEVDQFAKLNPEIQGILNAGHRRATATVIRSVGENFEPRQFSTWAPKAMTAVGSMPDSIEDRAIRLTMSRKPSGVQKAPRLGRTMDAASAHLQARSSRWAKDNAVALRSQEPRYLAGLNDRAQDNWNPLLTIASLCGEEVSARAERVARALVVGEEASVGELLLEHIRDAFGNEDKMRTEDLLRALIEREDGPWAKWWASDVDSSRYKAPASRLAKFLKPFGVEPKQLWIDGKKERGYEARTFLASWERYLGSGRPSPATDGRTVDVGAETASDLQPTLLPSLSVEPSAYRPTEGRMGCPACGGTFGHMTGCPEGGS